MNKKALLTTGVVALTALLAACGNGGSQKEASSTSSNGEFKDVKLVYWSNWDKAEPQGQVISSAVEEFEKETGAKVDIQFKGRKGIKEGLIPAIDANQQVDLFDSAANTSSYGERVIDLEDLVKKNDYEKNTNPALMEQIRSYHDGKLMEIPYAMKANLFMYNKKLFDEAGIKKAPETEAEFLEACQKLLDKGITPITGDDAYAPQILTRRVEKLMGDDIKTVAKEGKWDAEAMRSSAKFLEDLATKGYVSKYMGSNVWPTGQNTEFAQGKAAMYCAGTYVPNEVKNIVGPDFEWGFFPYPEIEGEKLGKDAMAIGSQSFSITSKCKDTDAAFALITKLTRGKWDQEYADKTMSIPTDKDNTNWPKQLAAVKPYFDRTTQPITSFGGLESNPQMTPYLKENIMKLYAKKINADEFVDNMLDAASKNK